MRFTSKTVRRSNVSLRLTEAADCALGGGSAEARGILIDDRDSWLKGACHRKVTELPPSPDQFVPAAAEWE